MSALFVRDITAEISQFLQNETGSAFCVPSTFGEKAVAALDAAGFAYRKVSVTLYQFAVEALCVTFRGADGKSRLDEALVAIYGHNRESAMSVACIGDRQFHPLVLPKEASVTVREALEKPKDVVARILEEKAVEEYRKLLEMLSRISGCWVYFHTETSGMRQPFPHEPGTIHIVTNSCPPGQATARYAQTAYGKLIDAKGLDVVGWHPTPGRGKSLKDSDGSPTLQMLGNTWYLLLPTLGNFNAQTSMYIFERLLGQAWSAHVASAETPAADEDELTAEAFGKLYGSWVDETPKLMETDIRKAEEQIAKLQEDLVTAHRTLNELRRFVSLLRDPANDRKMRKRAKEDWEAIKALPSVRRLAFVDDGLHVQTVPIHLKHGEHLYDLGSFTVRVSIRGKMSVWNDEIKQYKGIPHPHINEVGHPCYGNAGTAITQAAGEMRIADAVRYMLRWLTEGYTPALAEVKLETWPRVGETGEDYGKRLGLHQIHDPLAEERFIKESRMSDADAAIWRAAMELTGTILKDPKLDAILADPPGFTEASEQPQEQKQEESNDTPA